MDIEKKFFSSAVLFPDEFVQAMATRSLDPRVFTDTGLAIWGWLRTHFKEHGVPPGREAFRIQFEDYTLVKTGETPSFWMEKLREQYVYVRAQKAIVAASAFIKDDKPNEALDELKAAVFDVMALETTTETGNWSTGFADRFDQYLKLAESKGIVGMRSPFPELDRRTGGFGPGEYIVIVAPSGTGKTFFQLLLAYQAWADGNPVVYFTKEMSRMQIERRLDAIHFKLPFGEFRKGVMDDWTVEEYARQAAPEPDHDIEFSKPTAPFYVVGDEEGGVLATEARIQTTGAKIAYIDGFYLMTDDERVSKSSPWEGVMHISRGLKKMARRRNVPVIVTTQLTDEGKLAYFKGIERDADIIIELKQSKDQQFQSRLTLSIRKLRDGARGPDMELVWNLETMEFRVLEMDEELGSHLPSGDDRGPLSKSQEDLPY